MDVVDRWPTLRSVCPGFERGEWRRDDLARDIFDRHLLNFATNFSTFSTVTGDTAAADIRNAARIVYQTEKYRSRGEYGELLLHAILRDFYGSEPVVSKIFFKDSPNDTVKGFDAVHITFTEGKMELWLGEVKFYADLGDAVRDVAKELGLHLGDDYLRGEFIVVNNKVDPSWPHTERLSAMLDQNSSLDEIFDTLIVPIFLTYESRAIADNAAVCEAYTQALTREAEQAWEKLSTKIGASWDVDLRVILLPLDTKQAMVDSLHQKLDVWQRI